MPSEGDNFAIYERDSMTYAQVVGDVASGFMVEYQLGSTSRHYRAADTAVLLDAVVEIMQSFANGDDRYLSMQTWQLDEAVGGGGCGAPAATALMLFGGLLVALTALPTPQ